MDDRTLNWDLTEDVREELAEVFVVDRMLELFQQITQADQEQPTEQEVKTGNALIENLNAALDAGDSTQARQLLKAWVSGLRDEVLLHLATNPRVRLENSDGVDIVDAEMTARKLNTASAKIVN